MTPEQWKHIDELLEQALDYTASERDAFLDQACAGDEVLRRKVEALLSAHERAERFIETPAMEMVALTLAEQARTMVGRQLGHYQVLALLGSGGMGEVYRARDTRLDRIVALKLLLSRVDGDAERLRRFVREAKAASALNHPNIATIYEIGEAEGLHFIAMEYAEGQTLQARLNGQPLETAEIVEIASQIADALTEAHAKGITHRDVKPANVMLTARGQAKVLDFGLAKMSPPEAETVNYQSNTVTATTQPGVVLGTVPYMSPEQVLGREVDHRSDVFGLGVVLYEMITGRLPFAGATVSETMDRILHAQPEAVARFNHDVPTELERIVRKCLEKDREWRYQSARDLLIDLRNLKRDSGASAMQVETPVSLLKRASRWKTITISLTLGLFVMLVVWAVWLTASRRSTELAPPKIVPFTAFLGNEMQPSFSPDGNQIAFVWDGEKEDNPDIYVKQLGNESLRRLTTSSAVDTRPNWSPDGRYIAFMREIPEGSELYLIPSLGGAERRITQLSSQVGASNQISWSPDSEWLAASHKGSIFLVARDTGDMRKLTSPPPTSDGDRAPAISPDGKMVAFFRNFDLYLVPTAGGEPKRLVSDNTQSWSPAWTADGSEILFLSARSGDSRSSLWRVPAGGGIPQQVEAAGQNLDSFAVSRDGKRLAWTHTVGDQNIWRMELADTESAAGRQQATQSAKLLLSSTRNDSDPQISPDGKKIVFGSDRSGSHEIWVAESTGERPVQLTFFNRSLTGSPYWSPDGRQIVFDSRAEGRGDIYVISVEGGKPRRLTTDPAEDVAPSWSRDGNWIYFCSTRSGSHRIWKMPATGGEAVLITNQGEGGHESIESPDGQFLYYQKRRLVSGIWRVPVAGGAETLILDHHRAGFWRHWTVVEQGIYFATAEQPDQPLIEFFSFATGRVTLVATLQKRIDPWAPGLAVSPDGRWLIWSQVDQVGSDIMLMENFR